MRAIWRGKELLARRVGISFLVAVVIMIATWFYMNSAYTLAVEDGLFEKEVIWKNRIQHEKPVKNKSFVFINTGNDLKLVDDTVGLGSVLVTDRYKLLRLFQLMSTTQGRPEYIWLNLKFDYPYQNSLDSNKIIGNQSCRLPDFPVLSTDAALQKILKCFPGLIISAFYGHDTLKLPIFKGRYAISHYGTYGQHVNKIQLIYPGPRSYYAVPCLMHQDLDRARYQAGWFAAYTNGALSFKQVWPDYYYDAETLKKEKRYAIYSLNGVLEDCLVNHNIDKYTKGKIVIIGDLNSVMDTPAGRMPGTVALIDAYLTLLNGKQEISLTWMIMIFLAFVVLSYVSVFSQMFQLKLTNFLFAEQLADFLNKYISYQICLIVLSLVSVFIFNNNISLILPAFIFSAIASVKKILKPEQ